MVNVSGVIALCWSSRTLNGDDKIKAALNNGDSVTLIARLHVLANRTKATQLGEAAKTALASNGYTVPGRR